MTLPPSPMTEASLATRIVPLIGLTTVEVDALTTQAKPAPRSMTRTPGGASGR